MFDWPIILPPKRNDYSGSGFAGGVRMSTDGGTRESVMDALGDVRAGSVSPFSALTIDRRVVVHSASGKAVERIT